jgi:hypothetical protein
MQLLHVVSVDQYTRQRAFIALFNASKLIRHPLNNVKPGCEFEMLDPSLSIIRSGSLSSQFVMIRYLEMPEATMHRPSNMDSVDVSV